MDELALTLVHEAAHAVARVTLVGQVGAIDIPASGHGSTARDPWVYPTDLRAWPDLQRELICMLAGPMAEAHYWRAELGRREPFPEALQHGWGGDLRQMAALIRHFPDAPADWYDQVDAATRVELERPDVWHAITETARVIGDHALPIAWTGRAVTRVIQEALHEAR